MGGETGGFLGCWVEGSNPNAKRTSFLSAGQNVGFFIVGQQLCEKRGGKVL